MIYPAQRVVERIGKGAIASGYLLLGSELYWRDRLWRALRHALGLEGDSPGLQEADLRQGSLDAILAAAADRNLWVPRQLILVRNAQVLSTAKQLEPLAEYFRDPNPGTVLVFEMNDVDLDTEDWRERDKIKSRQQHWEELCEVALLASPSWKESLELVREEVAARGCRIAPEAAESLVAFTEGDFGRTVNEIEKLCLFCGSGAEIAVRDVELLAGSGGISPGRSLPQAIGSGEAATIFETFAARVPKGSYLPLVVADVTRYLRQLLVLREARPRTAQEAAKILWSVRLPAPPALLPELLRQARALSTDHLMRCFQAALRTERALRSSPADDRSLVERLLLEIASPLRARGGAPPAAT